MLALILALSLAVSLLGTIIALTASPPNAGRSLRWATFLFAFTVGLVVGLNISTITGMTR